MWIDLLAVSPKIVLGKKHSRQPGQLNHVWKLDISRFFVCYNDLHGSVMKEPYRVSTQMFTAH